jgi:nitrite reductase/ring-hydroxylating ferredoxin subunit
VQVFASMGPDLAAGRGAAFFPAKDLPGPDTSLVYNDWYPAMRSSELRGRKMATAMLLGIPLVLGRKEDGSIFALRDSCPHRGIPLSCGWFDGTAVTCKYHGWVFEPESGQCMEIPSLTSQDSYPRRIYATAFPCQQRDGYAWVYIPKPGSGRVRMEARDALPSVPELPKFSDRYRSAHLTADLPCNVHQAWWWRSRHSIHEKEKHFEPIPQGFRMSAHTPSANSAPYKLLGVYGEPIETTIDFVLPNRRYETLRCGSKWFATLTTVTPTTPGNSRIDVYGAWNIFYRVPFVTTVAKFFAERFVRQDQLTMVQQAEGLKFNPGLMLIDDADRPAKWYFALKRARLESEETGRPMQHPMDGPVTLRWRS